MLLLRGSEGRTLEGFSVRSGLRIHPLTASRESSALALWRSARRRRSETFSNANLSVEQETAHPGTARHEVSGQDRWDASGASSPADLLRDSQDGAE